MPEGGAGATKTEADSSTGSTVVSGLFDAGLSKAIPVTVESNRARLRTDRQH